MRSGKLRNLITVQRATHGVDVGGTPLSVWSDLGTLRAEIVEQGAAESSGAQGAHDLLTMTFRTCFVDGMTNADRVIFNGYPLNVRSIEPDPRFREMLIKADARMSDLPPVSTLSTFLNPDGPNYIVGPDDEEETP